MDEGSGTRDGRDTDAPRPASAAEVSELCALLGVIFDDDPISEFVFPSPRRRARGLPKFFRSQIDGDLLRFGHVYTTGDHVGVAVWSPPGRPMPTGLRALAAMVPVAPHVVGHLTRTVRLLSAIERAHPKEPHWYLATLGTSPSLQGRGFGSRLMQPVLERCDSQGMPAYLESSKERNVPFYRRHGFEVTGEVGVEHGPKVWTMWREPRPPSA